MDSPKKILVVDDQAPIRHIMAFKLKTAGYTVEVACDGAEGLRAVAEFQPDVIVSDYQMPMMDGLQMCKALGSNPATKSIPIILVTSRDFDVTAKHREGTAIRFLRNKPFSPKDVLNLVEKVLKGESMDTPKAA